jgi:hypothetical protein
MSTVERKPPITPTERKAGYYALIRIILVVMAAVVIVIVTLPHVTSFVEWLGAVDTFGMKG